jgi:hypothetical protein
MNRGSRRSHTDFRWRLLTTACAVALCGSFADKAIAFELNDAGQFSLSLGGMWDHAQGDGATWSPEKFLTKASPGFPGPDKSEFEIAPPTSWDYDANAAFRPADTAWVFSAAVRYGRSRTARAAVYDTFPTPQNGGAGAAAAQPAAAANGYGNYSATVSHKESHIIADFEAGRDFGLGLWEGSGSSVLSLGARYVRFTGRTNINFKTVTKYATKIGTRHIARGFTGVGPRLSWDGSAPIWRWAGLFIDAGANGALLFGRQTTTLDQTYTAGAGYSHARRKAAIAKNFGGYAALSWRPFNLGAKISLGYRADLFFHALDGGDTRAHEIDRSFYGPFVSIGIQTR